DVTMVPRAPYHKATSVSASTRVRILETVTRIACVQTTTIEMVTRARTVDRNTIRKPAGTAYETTSITATWNKPQTELQVDYKASLDDDSTTTWSTNLTASFDNRTPGTRYYLTVSTRRIQDPGYGTQTVSVTSESVAFYTKPAIPGKLLQNTYQGVNSTQHDGRDVTIQFDKSDGNVDSYTVNVTQEGTGSPISGTIRVTPTAVYATFTNLIPDKSYDVTMIANSNGIPSNPQTDKFRVEAEPAGEVSQLNVSDTGSRWIRVTWQKPGTPNGVIKGYTRPNTSDCDQDLTVITKTLAELDNMSHVLDVSITGLLPDVMYDVHVIAFNQKGSGIKTDRQAETKQEAAVNLVSLTATSSTLKELNVSWTPGLRTGPTRYNVTWEEETGIGSNQFTLINSTIVSDYDTRQYTITGLLNYWKYQVTVFASTTQGSSPEPNVTQARTLDSQPGQLETFNVSQPTNSAQHLNLTVACPEERRRNGPIRAIGYNSTVVNTGVRFSSFQEAGPSGSDNTDCSRSFVIKAGSFVAETEYQINVFAITRNYHGEISTDNVTLQARAPSLNRRIIEKPATDAARETSVTVNVCTCLVDDDQGEITSACLIVCRKSEDCKPEPPTSDNQVCETLPTWKMFQQKPSTRGYRPTPDDWHESSTFRDASRRRRSVLHRERRAAAEAAIPYTIGNDTDCGNKDQSVFCNGPLQPDTEYIIIAVACTRGGCAEYNLPSVIRTLAEPEDNTPVGAIVGGVIGAVVAVAVVIFAIFFVRRYQRSPGGHSPIIEEPHIMKKPVRKPIKLRDFDAHIARLHKDANLLFQEEFEDIQENSPKHFTQDFALMDANKVKNRYVNILPFDHTRVKLNSDDDEEFSDFVNANYIPGYSSPREYIATQGPITCTIDDFWRMIWEQKSSIIVMLSDLAEKGRPKVDLYWPTEVNSPVQYGDIIVELTANSTLNKCTIRNFKILMENQEERKVTQYFIPGWEDYGANLSPDDLLDFIKMVRQEARSTQGPITVHCSAGVGRTGTFIALDFLMQFVDDHDLDAEVDIYNLVLNMRHNRPHMVQSEKQYVFIHDALKLIIERKVRAMEEAENEGLYQNTGFQDNVYANQAFGQ
ncbi:hypothetical protein BaRGS_00037823, partial [Batillaria attramentaria]